MTLREFASEHGLKVRRSEDGSPEIRGRVAKSRPGERRISSYGSGRLLLSVSNPNQLPEDRRLSARGWGYVKRRCLEAGMSLHQDGDEEGSLSFDPSEPAQADAAIQEAGCRRKRKMSPKQRQQALAALERARPVA